MSSETLKFKISISGTYHSKVPEYSIWLDDQMIKRDKISVASDEIETIEFSSTIADGDHAISIRLENKAGPDTIKDVESPDSFAIVKDMLLNIKGIEVDGTSIGRLIWDGVFILDEPHEYNGKTIIHMDNCVNLGWNGAYVFKFESPFYIWLLENL